MKPGPLDRIAERRPWQSLDGVWITLSVRERDALVEVARAARALFPVGFELTNEQAEVLARPYMALHDALARLESP